MSIIHKVEHWPSSIVNLGLLFMDEQVGDVILGKQRAAEDSHYLTDIPVEFEVMLDNCNKAICNDDRVYLYVNRIHAIAPEVLDSEVLLYEFEKQLHHPSVLVQKSNVLGRQIEVVGIIGESPFELFRVEHDSPYGCWIMFLVTPCREYHSLVSEHAICTIQQVVSCHDLKLRFPPFP